MQTKHLTASSSNQAYARIEIILKESMGLHSASIGSPTIINSIQRRIKACGQNNVEHYLAQLLSKNGELDALIEEVVIPETWFFRDDKAFQALHRYVTKEWMSTDTPRKLRVLCLPCSTGEEAYSIAMTLKDTGLAQSRVHIDAVDISVLALAIARRAVYGSNAFRGNDISFRERFFHYSDGVYKLDESIRQSVNFVQANILEPSFMPGQGMYDVIFCRNVMIYFDSPTQARAVAVLSRLLQQKGVLFVGHAESSMLLNHDYASEHIFRAFSFRKCDAKKNAVSKAYTNRDIQKYKQNKISHHAVPQLEAHRVSNPPQVKKKKTCSEDGLNQVFALANIGNLSEAANLCECWLENHEPCAKACYLMGLIREAEGNHQQAEDYFRKAIYLQPDHQEALVHLALIVEQRGDSSAAKILHQRANRVMKTEVSSHSRNQDG